MVEHAHSHDLGRRTALISALTITTVFLAVEAIGGILTNSLALLSDAGHMLSDASALGLSLFAVWLAGRPHTVSRTYGYHRTEVIAALANGLTLLGVSIYIFWEAARRFGEPPDVETLPMLVVAALGLVANGASGLLLSRAADGGLNVRSAFLHVLGDALGSLGAISAGIVMLTTGWFLADALISVGIALLILLSAWRVTREALGIVLEFAPGHVEMKDVRSALLSIDGIAGVHDLHVWTITSGFVALSCHAQIDQEANVSNIIARGTNELRDRFQIHHATIQPEPAPIHHDEAVPVCCLDQHAVSAQESVR